MQSLHCGVTRRVSGSFVISTSTMGLVTCGLVNIGHRVTIQLHQTKDHIYIILINGLSEIHDKETDRRRKFTKLIPIHTTLEMHKFSSIVKFGAQE